MASCVSCSNRGRPRLASSSLFAYIVSQFMKQCCIIFAIDRCDSFLKICKKDSLTVTEDPGPYLFRQGFLALPRICNKFSILTFIEHRICKTWTMSLIISKLGIIAYLITPKEAGKVIKIVW
jgi:hypothetical protein